MGDLRAVFEAAASSGALHLSYLGLTEVPAAVFAIPNLRRLDLGHNNLHSLPAALGQLTHLEELWVNDNPLLQVPPEIEGCLSLKILDLRNTDITKLPKEVSRLQSLVEIALSGTALNSKIQAAYNAGGTLTLLSYLAQRDARRELKEALRTRLTVDVYPESADTPDGREQVVALVRAVFAEFSSLDEIRTVTRNAERLMPRELATARASEVRKAYEVLAQDNARKAIGAEIELALRAIYYGDEWLTPPRTEAIVHDIQSHLPTLEDGRFFVGHASRLLPARASEVRGTTVYAAVASYKAQLAEERAAGIAILTKALSSVYADRDKEDVNALVTALASGLRSADDLRSLAADAHDLFPAEFGAVKVKRILEQFQARKKEKGL